MRRLINQHPGRAAGLALGVLPFIALLVLYVIASHLRLAENPDDKLLPALGKIASTFHSYAFEEDSRSGDGAVLGRHLGQPASASASALVISATLGMVLAIAHRRGAATARALLSPLLGTIAMIPPLAILPVLFIVLGLEETAKIALIVIGIAPCIARDLALRVGELPKEQIIKAQTLGASTWQLDPARGAAAAVAAADRFAAAVAGLGVAVPDRRRSHRLHRRARLSHLPRAPLPRDGRDPALRRVDHAARRAHRPRAARCCARARSAGRSRSADGHRHRPQCLEGVRPDRSCSKTCAWRSPTTSS